MSANDPPDSEVLPEDAGAVVPRMVPAMTYAWSIGTDLVKGCGDLSGVQITREPDGWFSLDWRPNGTGKIRIRGPFSSNSAALDSVEQREGVR